jgi:formamidopyrimidine-DNA glycosylase
MPELPEVEIFRRFMERHALNQPIEGVDVLHPKGLRDLSPETFRKISINHSFTETIRRGKHLLAKLEPAAGQHTKTKSQHSPTPWLLFHFGMTGIFSYKAPGQPSVNAYEDTINRDAHIRVRFTLTDGGQFNFHDQRLFGYISQVDDPEAYFREKKLGPDALSVDEAEFTRQLARKKGALKPVLMDQSVVAGLGNIYADELLFQAQLHPAHPVSSLKPKAVRQLHELMQDILNRTIALDVERDDLPAHYLWHQRKAGCHCPRDGQPLHVETIGGRTTYFCPKCQK